MIGHCSSGQISEIKQCDHAGTLGHSESKVLLSKKGKNAKRTFLKPVSEYSYGNPELLLGSKPYLARLCLATRGNLSVPEKCEKNVGLKTPKKIYFA